MTYTINIPTLENLEARQAKARNVNQALLMETVSRGMEASADHCINYFKLELNNLDFVADTWIINEVQNVLREMGYLTEYQPRKALLFVYWDDKSQRVLAQMKAAPCQWKLPTYEQHLESLKKINEILYKGA